MIGPMEITILLQPMGGPRRRTLAPALVVQMADRGNPFADDLDFYAVVTLLNHLGLPCGQPMGTATEEGTLDSTRRWVVFEFDDLAVDQPGWYKFSVQIFARGNAMNPRPVSFGTESTDHVIRIESRVNADSSTC